MSKAIALKPRQINNVLRKIELMQDKETKKAAIAISHAGLRVSEMARLEVQDIMYPSGKLKTEVFLRAAICKGLKPRTIWLSNKKTQQIIQELIDYRLKKRWGTSLNPKEYQGLIPESRLLYNNRGRPFALITKQVEMADGSIQSYKACETLRAMIQGIYNRCGFKKASSHTGRKSLATNAALRGVKLSEIAAILGHEDEEMTLEYICIDQQRIKKAYEVGF